MNTTTTSTSCEDRLEKMRAWKNRNARRAQRLLTQNRELKTRIAELEQQLAATTTNTPGLNASVDALKTYVAQYAADTYGWIGNEWEAIDWLVHKESSWRPEAANSRSTAFGLFQFLKQTAVNYEIDHPDLNGQVPSVASQVEAGLQYVEDRYGTPSAAAAFHRNNNWY